MNMNSGARKPGGRLRANILAVLASSVITFLAGELIIGYLLWIQKAGMSSTTYYAASAMYSRLYRPRQYMSYSPKSPYIPDQYLGYSDLPGVYTVKLSERTGNYHSFTTTINKDGNRITSFSPELVEGKKEIWIFGDSRAYGWGNNDETTFPFLLQQFLPRFCIVNYADNGYGNVHAYLQLKRELEKNNVPPEIIVIVYSDYFNARNVAAPSRLKEYKEGETVQNSKIDPSAFLHPRALVNSGKLEIEYVPLFWRFNKGFNDKDPSKEYQYEVTKKILSEIYSIGERNGVKMMLAIIAGPESDEVISFSRKIGYVISDIRPKSDRYEFDSFAQFDSHPGPLAQDNFAIKLYKSISKVISDTGE